MAAASYLLFYDIFAPQKVPFLRIFDDVIACDLWFCPPPPFPIKNPGYAYVMMSVKLCSAVMLLKRLITQLQSSFCKCKQLVRFL